MEKIYESQYDYQPRKVLGHYHSPTGIIALLRLRKINNLNLLQRILKFFYVYKVKDVYCWLPTKDVVSASSKYGVIGSKSRDPYAKQWFEVQDSCDIYTQGYNTYIARMRNYRVTSSPNIPFELNDLTTLTRKASIKLLDEYVFKLPNNY